MASPIRVVLDTNAIYGDVHAERPYLRALLSSSDNREVDLVIPQVVLDELTRQYPDRLDRFRRDLKSAIGRLAREAQALGVPPIDATVIPRVEPAGYSTRLRRWLLDNHARIIPTPADLGQVVSWSVMKRKPFKPSGAGLPDAVVWATVLAEARRGQVVLVTANTEDFADPGDTTRPHPDLLADLAAAKIPMSRVRLVPDLKTLLDQIVRPMTLPDARAERLLTDDSTRPVVRRAIAEALLYEPISATDVDLDIDLVADPQITDARLGDVTLLTARELAPGRLLLDLEVTASLTLDLEVSTEDAEQLDFSTSISVIGNANNDYYIDAQTEVDALLRIEATTNLDASDFEVALSSLRTY